MTPKKPTQKRGRKPSAGPKKRTSNRNQRAPGAPKLAQFQGRSPQNTYSPSKAVWNERAERLFSSAIARAKALHRSELGQDVRRLSELFTKERSSRSANYMAEPGLLRAYLGYYAPKNAIKIGAILQQLEQEGHFTLPPRGKGDLESQLFPRILDLGAGPLSGVLGAWLAFGGVDPDSLAVDLAQRALSEGAGLLGVLERGAQVRTKVANLTGARSDWQPAKPVSLCVLANVLNEFDDARQDYRRRIALIEHALAAVAPGGGVLVVEPATRVAGRALMQVRDALEQAQPGRVVAPCTGAHGCPLLSNPRDWCHMEMPWERPSEVAALERRAKLGQEPLKASYLFVRAASPSEAQPRRKRGGLRLIGGLMTDRQGIQRRYGCDQSGIRTLRGEEKRLPASVAHPPRGALVMDRPLGVIDERPRRR